MQRYIVSLAQHRLQVNDLYTQFLHRRRVHVWIVYQHLESQTSTLGSRRLPNPTATDDAQGLVTEPVEGAARFTVPDTLACRAEKTGQPARLRQHQRNGMGRDLINRIVGRICHPDAPLRGGPDFDGVQSRANAADQTTAFQALDEFRPHRLDSDHQGIALPCGLPGLLRIQVAHMLNLEAGGAENLSFNLDIPKTGVSDHDVRVHGFFSLITME